MAIGEKTKRPFQKLKGVSKDNDEYAIVNDRRPFVFSMVFSDGSKVESEGSVRPADCKRMAEIFKELMALAKK